MTITELMKKLSFSEEDIECILNANEICGDTLEKEAQRFFSGEAEYVEVFDAVVKIEMKDVHEYTIQALFLLICAVKTKARYEEAGLGEELYIQSMYDIKYKIDECRMVYDVCGTFTGEWFGDWFNLKRFAHGRLQYDYRTFKRLELDEYKKGGFVVTKDDTVLSCHIPASGPLTQESVYESLKMAYEFNKDMEFVKKYGVLPVLCGSWLLYPDHKALFGKNTVQFVEMFDIFKVNEAEDFSNGWRIFKHHWGKSTAELPEDTSLQRNFKKWILDGGKFGAAYGILFFDGENIVKPGDV